MVLGRTLERLSLHTIWPHIFNSFAHGCMQGRTYTGRDAAPRAFMRNALQVYGLQHFVHNLVQDVHKACKYWETYYEHLQTLSAILTMRERRRRFIVCCVRNSPHAHEGHKFDHFDAHLYTKRWREVTNFSKALLKVVWLFAETWSEKNYLAGRAHADDDLDGAIGALDTGKVTLTLKDPMFRRYLILVVTVDSIPEDNIAKWGAGCPCHEPLRMRKSQYMFSRMMEAHYGKGHSECMGAGCRASELAAGWVLETVFHHARQSCLCASLSEGQPMFGKVSSDSFALVIHVKNKSLSLHGFAPLEKARFQWPLFYLQKWCFCIRKRMPLWSTVVCSRCCGQDARYILRPSEEQHSKQKTVSRKSSK